MFESVKDLVFIDVNEGTSQKSGKKYRMFRLGDPETFENYTLSADPEKQFGVFTKGEKVRVRLNLVDFYGRTQVEIADILPAVSSSKKVV